MLAYGSPVPWTAALLIAVASNLDNLTVAIGLGMRPVAVPARANAIIAGVTMLGTAIAVGAGDALATVVPAHLARLVGGLTLAAIGAATSVGGILSLRGGRFPDTGGGRGTPPPASDPEGARDAHEILGTREALLLGVALALNNLAAGIPAGAARISLPLVTFLAGAFSLLAVGGGTRLGLGAGRLIGRWAPTAAGSSSCSWRSSPLRADIPALHGAGPRRIGTRRATLVTCSPASRARCTCSSSW